jgi:dihydroxy-acid dehydratase
VVLYGNLAPEGAVAKIAGREGLRFIGKARVFNSEEQAIERILAGAIYKDDVVVIRYEDPK